MGQFNIRLTANILVDISVYITFTCPHINQIFHLNVLVASTCPAQNKSHFSFSLVLCASTFSVRIFDVDAISKRLL